MNRKKRLAKFRNCELRKGNPYKDLKEKSSDSFKRILFRQNRGFIFNFSRTEGEYLSYFMDKLKASYFLRLFDKVAELFRSFKNMLRLSFRCSLTSGNCRQLPNARWTKLNIIVHIVRPNAKANPENAFSKLLNLANLGEWLSF